MFYSNCGSLDVQTEMVEQVIRKLVEKGIFDSEDDVDVCEVFPGISGIDIGAGKPCYGDIEMDLSNAVSELKEAGILVNGQVTYDGDYSGVYEIVDGELKQYSEDEWAVREAMKEQRIIGKPLADEISDKVKVAQLIPGLPFTAYIALGEILKLVEESR